MFRPNTFANSLTTSGAAVMGPKASNQALVTASWKSATYLFWPSFGFSGTSSESREHGVQTTWPPPQVGHNVEQAADACTLLRHISQLRRFPEPVPLQTEQMSSATMLPPGPDLLAFEAEESVCFDFLDGLGAFELDFDLVPLALAFVALAHRGPLSPPAVTHSGEGLRSTKGYMGSGMTGLTS